MFFRKRDREKIDAGVLEKFRPRARRPKPPRRAAFRHTLNPKGIEVSDEELASLNIKRDKFHPEWNYAIAPRNQNVER